MIEVQQLNFEYPGKRALQDVSFSIPAGAITALVGPNGSGKTTLLRCLAALSDPTSGTVRVNGYHTVDQPHEVHLSVGYLKDLFGLYNELTVEQSIRFMAYSRIPVDQNPEAAALLAAQRTGANRFLKQKVSSLSRGMRQRVGIAQAIIHAPKVLLLDEPASGLDPEGRYELSALLNQLRDTGMTIIVSSHILAELEDYSSEMLIIREGRMIEHRQLANREPSRQIRIINIRLTENDKSYRDAIAGMRGVRNAQVADDRLLIELDLAMTSRPELLRQLVQADIPVEEFSDQKVDLQQEYIRSVNQNNA